MARKNLVTSAKQARYRTVAEDLIAKIKSNVFPVGSHLKGELELAAHYQISRHTMRAALRVLTDLGLIERHARAGTMIKARTPRESYLQILRSPAELLQYPVNARVVVHEIERVTADQDLSGLLRCPVKSKWCRVGALRRFRPSNLPICWLDLYVVPEYAPMAKRVGKNGKAVYEMIEEAYGERVETVYIEIKAAAISERHAYALDCAAGTPALVVIRRYLGKGGRTFQVAVSEHPANRYNYQLELRRGWESEGAWAI